jgi:hypothetical protein
MKNMRSFGIFLGCDMRKLYQTTIQFAYRLQVKIIYSFSEHLQTYEGGAEFPLQKRRSCVISWILWELTSGSSFLIWTASRRKCGGITREGIRAEAMRNLLAGLARRFTPPRNETPHPPEPSTGTRVEEGRTLSR